MPVSRSRRTKRSGRRPHAGRFAFSQQLALRLMARAALLCVVLVLGASTVSDPVQALVHEGVAETLSKNQTHTPFADSTLRMRAALLRRTAGAPDAVRGLDRNELTIVFGQPSLIRHEGDVNTWQFASSECALDLYFKGEGARPVYAEYRVRGSAEGGQAPKIILNHRTCLKSLFVKVEPLAPEL